MSAFTGITVDREALIANYATIAEQVAPAGVIAVVKANGYGHGAAEAARAFVDAGAEWLGVADIDEGIALRQAGIDEHVRILAWLHAPDEDFRRAARWVSRPRCRACPSSPPPPTPRCPPCTCASTPG